MQQQLPLPHQVCRRYGPGFHVCRIRAAPPICQCINSLTTWFDYCFLDLDVTKTNKLRMGQNRRAGNTSHTYKPMKDQEAEQVTNFEYLETNRQQSVPASMVYKSLNERVFLYLTLSYGMVWLARLLETNSSSGTYFPNPQPKRQFRSTRTPPILSIRNYSGQKELLQEVIYSISCEHPQQQELGTHLHLIQMSRLKVAFSI